MQVRESNGSPVFGVVSAILAAQIQSVLLETIQWHFHANAAIDFTNVFVNESRTKLYTRKASI